MPNNSPPTALADFILLNEEIAALVRARIPLEANLERIGAELPGKSGELAERIGRRMQTGENLAQAMEAECGSMPPAYRAAMVAGVESGQLGKALEAVVESATRMDQLRRVSALALVYPLILIGIVFPLLTLMLVLLVPRFAWLDDSQFKPLEWLVDTPNVAPILAFAVPLIMIVTAVIWWWRSGRIGYQPRFSLLGLLTGSSRVRRWSQASQFAETMTLLLERGIPLPQSLRLAGEASDDRRLRAAALETAQHIEHGGTPSSSASSAKGRTSDFPVLIRLAMHHADNGRLLIASLRQARTMYRDRAIRAADWYTEYLPILLTVAIGGTFTVVFALFVFWPYASMLHELSQWKGR
jgi:type II secretory pathway component PulF